METSYLRSRKINGVWRQSTGIGFSEAGMEVMDDDTPESECICAESFILPSRGVGHIVCGSAKRKARRAMRRARKLADR